MARPRLCDAIELVSVRLAPEDVVTLDQVAEHDHECRSEIMRQALRAYLHKRRITLSMGGGCDAA